MNLPPAKKRLGQNFLVDESYVRRIVEALSPRADETVVEIGPGRGALTARLVESAARVIAIEYDRELVSLLRQRFEGRGNFTVVGYDALKFDFCSAIEPAKSARVIANLPYNVSTPILGSLVRRHRCITEMVLMLQREVVERITAPPGSSERGYLTVMVEAFCDTEALFDVPPGAFRPVPKVWSTVARLRTRVRADNELVEFWLSVLAGEGFKQKRKTILNNFRAARAALREEIERAVGGPEAFLEAAGVEPQRRAESLTIDEWLRLARLLS